MPNEFSTGRKFRPDILFTRNRAKVSFCSDGTVTLAVVLPSPHAHNISLTKCKMASRKRKANSDGSTDNEYFTWTDEETALRLNVALSYKNENTCEGEEWESIRTRYEELQELFIERYKLLYNVYNVIMLNIVYAIVLSQAAQGHVSRKSQRLIHERVTRCVTRC